MRELLIRDDINPELSKNKKKLTIRKQIRRIIMKTAILRTAILALIALPLAAGSALAAGLSLEIYGQAYLYDINGTGTDDIELAYSVGVKLDQWDYDWYSPGADPFQPRIDVPGEFQFQFRDSLLTNESTWQNFDTYDCSGYCQGFTIGDFIFTVNDLGEDAYLEITDDYSYISLRYATGFVNGFEADFQIEINNDPSYNEYFKTDFAWNILFWIDADDFVPGGDYPTEPIPEPGTLVLLGTGLLGALAIARRKMKK